MSVPGDPRRLVARLGRGGADLQVLLHVLSRVRVGEPEHALLCQVINQGRVVCFNELVEEP